MNPSTLLILIAGLTFLAFLTGRRRSVAIATRGARSGRPSLHSLPGYYGSYVALWCAIPALLLFAIWQVIEPSVLRAQVISTLSAETQALPEQELGLIYNDIQNLVQERLVAREPSAEVLGCCGAL